MIYYCIRPHSLAWSRTDGSQPLDTGSNPVGAIFLSRRFPQLLSPQIITNQLFIKKLCEVCIVSASIIRGGEKCRNVPESISYQIHWCITCITGGMDDRPYFMMPQTMIIFCLCCTHIRSVS